ncbi:MAG: VOC family protein [Pseudomonadales bacterium]|nr:VOC family protein [Pseudomonadales bacterium]
MLSQSRLQTIIWTSRLPAAEAFYRDVLGLTVKSRSDGAVVFDVGGADLRLSPVPATSPSEHTVAGFEVPDLDAVVATLGERGVAFERFEGFPHASNGVLVTPNGSSVAWFRDPDGNLLSVVRFAGST